MKLLGIIGRMGTGKSTLARDLAVRLGGKVYSFADALREEVSTEYGIPLDDLRAKPTPPHIRELLQHHGTDVRRAQDKSYWIKRMACRLVHCDLPAVVIDDIRFEDEVYLTKAFGGILIQLWPYEGYEAGQGAGHASEQQELGRHADYTFCPDFGKLSSVADEMILVMGRMG